MTDYAFNAANMPYEISPLAAEAAAEDRAAGMAFFLMDNTGSVLGHWAGRMAAKDQRKLFGKVIGRGVIIIDGDDETVGHNVSVCFGTMRETVWRESWTKICRAFKR